MSTWLITGNLFIGAALQTILPRPAILGSNEWPILIGMTLCIALKSTRSRVAYTALLAGFLHDLFSPAPLGISFPFFALIAWGGTAIREEVFNDQTITYCVLGMLGGLFKTLYFTLVFAGTGLRWIEPGPFAIRGVGNIFLGLIATPLIFGLVFKGRCTQVRTQRWISE